MARRSQLLVAFACALCTIAALPSTASAQTASAGQLVISELRLHGANGASDEYIEVTNVSGAEHTVTAASGTGYGVAASDGVTRCVLPNSTVIPNRGHFLCVNSVGYSLAAYPGGSGTTATGDATYTTAIPNNAGIALFNNTTSYIAASRLDAVGATTEANTTYREGTGYTAFVAADVNFALTRRIGTYALPQTRTATAATSASSPWTATARCPQPCSARRAPRISTRRSRSISLRCP